MKPTVYIETTILGHLTSRLPKDKSVADQMLVTRRWWKESQGEFELFTSQAVIAEAGRGDPVAAAERLEAIKFVRLVPTTDGAAALAEFLIQQHALPAKAHLDALHLATAAANGIRYLLTWNCRHLANPDLQAKNTKSVRRLGFESPIICTPVELGEV